MTRRTRPAPPRTDDRSAPVRSLALAALLAGLALSGACGSLSRAMFARNDASKVRTPEQQAELLGADPMFPQLWLWTAQRATTPEAAMTLIESGRRFHPNEPELLLAQLSLLSLMKRFDGLQQLANNALQWDCPTDLEVWLRWWLVVADLAVNDTAAAEAEVVRLGGVRGAPPAQVADAWAQIAVSCEFLGHPEQADQALENSLDLAPDGVLALRQAAAREPQRQAACDALLSRARARHPDHPDLILQLVISALLAHDSTAADQALAQLPTPLPERLEGTVQLLRVRADVLADRTQPALVVLRARLDEDPTDEAALGALIECWRLRQKPSAEEMRLRLSWASGRIGDPFLASQVKALLRELTPAPEPAPAPEAAPAQPPASQPEPEPAAAPAESPR